MYFTGGTGCPERASMACAPAAPTIWCGCPTLLCEYTAFTGDEAVWDVPVPFLTAEPLREEEDDRYFEPAVSDCREPLYEHGARALDRALTAGEHGLPLIGSGDWNDGFSLLGVKGRGESVWLAMFLSLTLDHFAPVAHRRGDEGRAARYRTAAAEYRRAAEACFDGDRYLRAFADDGTPLGRAGQPACALDSLTQSFAVLAGLDAVRAGTSLDTALRELVDREHGVVRLFAPGLLLAVRYRRRRGRTGGLYLLLSPRAPGKRRAVHPCGGVVGYGPSGKRPGGGGGRLAADAQSPPPNTPGIPDCTAANPMHWAGTFTPTRKSPAGRDGPGTPGRRDGMLPPSSVPYWD